MRVASPPRQMECENEMIIISQPLFCFGASGAAKETHRGSAGRERGGTVFRKTKAKCDFCAREPSAETMKKRILYLRSQIYILL